MLNTAEFDYIHQSMIAGQVPNHRGDVHLSIFYTARDILDTDRLHMLVSLSEDESVAYYLSAPSACFTGGAEFSTPLAAAFPAHPEHRGDGIYIVINGSRSVLIEKGPNVFRLMSNATSVLQEYVKTSAATVYDVSGGAGWTMESTARSYRRLADKISRATIKVSAIIIAASLGLSLVAAAVGGHLSASLQAGEDTKVGEINGLINRVEFTSPLNHQVGRLQKLGATVVRAGGWIDEYELKGARESFRIAMPEWVTQDYIDVLGKGVVAEHDRADNVVIFSKGAAAGSAAGTAAPAAAPAAPRPVQEKTK